MWEPITTMSNNQRQFKKQYSQLHKYVYRYVAYRVSHREDAEDIVSTIFLTALDRLDQYDEGRGNMRQWLTGIARFKILNYWRGRKTTVSLDEIFELPDKSFAANTVGHISVQLEVEVILKKVNPDMKALLAMKYVDGLTFKEMAELLGEQPDALRQRFSRLHRQLRVEFQEQDEETSV